MKRVIMFIVLAATLMSAAAQQTQKNRIGVQLGVDFVTNGDHNKGTYGQECFGSYGLSVSYKCFVKGNWFVRPAASLYTMSYDTGRRLNVGASEQASTRYVSIKLDYYKRTSLYKLSEWGVGAGVDGGYCFPKKKNFSVDLFGGLNYRWAMRCGGIDDMPLKYAYYPTYLSWKAGVNVNYRWLTLSAGVGTYLTKRHKYFEDSNTPTVYSLGVGVNF